MCVSFLLLLIHWFILVILGVQQGIEKLKAFEISKGCTLYVHTTLANRSWITLCCKYFMFSADVSSAKVVKQSKMHPGLSIVQS